MKYTRIILIGLAIVLLVYLYFGVYLGRQQSNIQNSDTGKATQSQLQAKTDVQGEVSVTVTPEILGKDSPQWKFNVAFNTHSVALDQDPVQISTLTDDKGIVYKPVSWEGAGPGGHHREGVLFFTAIVPLPQSVEIKIKDVGGIPQRTFKWALK